MSADTPIETLIDSVADGDDIDWAALEAKADPEVLALLAHLKTVERIIGFKRGTGGSSGVGYLEHVLKKGFFPELISLRTSI